MKDIKKEEKKKEVLTDIPKVKASSANTLIVGESKTTFMSELPVLRVPEEKEIKPFKSEPLAIIIEEEEEPDPVDFDVERSPDFDDDEAAYYYADADDYFDNPMNSSGVSFEELSQTIEVLSKDDPTDKEKGKAVQVLNTIEDTELFQFITINNSVYNNAKVLMALFNSNRYESDDDFNINRYME